MNGYILNIYIYIDVYVKNYCADRFDGYMRQLDGHENQLDETIRRKAYMSASALARYSGVRLGSNASTVSCNRLA